MVKSSKLRNILYSLFVVVIVGLVIYGVLIVRRNANSSVNTFTSDGYAIYLTPNSIKASVAPFKNGEEYAYKKYGNKVAIDSKNGKTTIDDDSVIHYQNGNIIVLKNTVGIDLETIDDELILYYNLFKNTEIKHDEANGYYVEGIDKKVNYKKLLLRINDNKYLLAGNNVRAMMFNEQIVDFGNYLYFEYVNGSVIKLYNHDKYYQTVSSDTKIVVDDITIDLNDKVISKNNVPKITLSNLVIDMDGNIDIITYEAEVNKVKPEKPKIDKNVPVPEDNGNSGVVGNEETEDDKKNHKVPEFKVTALTVTALKIDANIEITDEDGLLIDPVVFSIVENATATKVYEEELRDGNLNAFISYPNLKPDTEYTLYAKASYKIDDVTFDKSFISKIFRTESLGVSIRKSYVTKNSVIVDLYKENYSKVSSVTVGIYNESSDLIDYKKIDLLDQTKTKYQVEFDELEHNKTYIVKMYDILSSGVVVDDGYSQVLTVKTLKKAPVIEDLTYRVNKVDSTFELDVKKVIDEDYGITNYRYEVFDTRQDLNNSEPVVSIEQKNLGIVSVLVDENRVHRGVGYTYRLVVEFNDNEKTIEYAKNLGLVMQLDGVEFPTLRWQETKVTWEQIRGSIIIDDPKGTLQSNIYKVVYKNSIDMYNVNTIVTETPQNIIPISVNYLRANETYTFDVYATINLQDGNETASQTYIGSVNVQTKKPNSLTASFSKSDSYSDVFAINFRLSDFTDSASFEASTLTSLNFTLYQGATTDGKVEAFKKKIDLNDDEYTSGLKQAFYDDSAVINANFFDADNADFKQKTYTLVVDAAYDYTGYDSNIIPIKSNTYQFDVNNYIPSLPDPNVSQVTVKQILNKFATSFGMEYDDNLDPNTVVGLNAIATYDNNSNSAKYLIYHVWVKNTNGEFVKLPELDKKVYFNNDGTIQSTNFNVLSGTSVSTFDTDAIRRGNDYHISFEAYLDVDNDGEVDTIYPNAIDETYILKSDDISIKKQTTDFKLYPSVSNSNSMTWKYIYTDVDKALVNNNLYGYINANSSASSSPSISESNEYQAATFTGLSKGKTLTIKKAEKLLKNNPTTYTSLTSQYFYGYSSSINLSYTVTSANNLVTLTINDYNYKTEIINSISSMNVIVEPVNASDRARLGTKTIENVSLRNGKITINYFDIKEYFNVDIALKLVANYDSGEIGFDYQSTYLALQNGTYSEIGNYYTFTGQLLTQVSSIYGNVMNINFNPYDKTLVLTNKDNRTLNLSVNIDQTGVVYNNNNLIAKNTIDSNLTSSDNTIKFDRIIPGISIMNSSNKVDIVPLLTGAYVNAKLTTNENINIENNLIYFELYETNANGTNAQYIDTLSHNVSEFSDSIMIDNLKHKSNYYIRVYANVYNINTSSYEKTYLYDVDQQTLGCLYNFHTLSDVGITNIEATFIANSYTNKKVSINYELENVTGYNYITYELYKKVNNNYEKVNINIPNSTNFFKNMHIDINATPSSNNEIVYGGQYKIVIKSFGEYTSNGVTNELNLGESEHEFTIPNYKTPYVGITSGKSEDTIYFRVTITDTSHVIDGDKYEVRLLDSNNNVIATESNISTSSINKKFSFSASEHGLVNGQTYTFDVIIKNDYTNRRQNLVTIHKKRSMQYGSSIDLGTVVLSANSSSSFDLIFSDSYKLTSIDKVTYSISSINTGFYVSNTSDFNVRYEPSSNLYIYTINLQDVSLTGDNVYLFTFNFYENDNLVTEVEIDYYNGGN